MTHWLRDGVLGIVILLGAILAWRSGVTRAELAQEERRLTLLVGSFEGLDPSQMHIRAIRTNDPMHFAWRVYLPTKYPDKSGMNIGRWGFVRGEGQAFAECHCIARLIFRELPDGDVAVYTTFGTKHSLSQFGEPGLTKLLHGRWQECVVSQIGADETVSLKADEHVSLLRITMSKKLEADAKKQLDVLAQERFKSQILLWWWGNHPESQHPSAPQLGPNWKRRVID